MLLHFGVDLVADPSDLTHQRAWTLIVPPYYSHSSHYSYSGNLKPKNALCSCLLRSLIRLQQVIALPIGPLVGSTTTRVLSFDIHIRQPTLAYSLRNKEWANAIPFYHACITVLRPHRRLEEVVRSPSRDHRLASARARIELQAANRLAKAFTGRDVTYKVYFKCSSISMMAAWLPQR